MRAVVALLILLSLPVSAREVVSYSRAASTFFIVLDDAKLDLTFQSSTAVHVRAQRPDALPSLPIQPAEHPQVLVAESSSTILFRTREFAVRIERKPFKVSFESLNEIPMIAGAIWEEEEQVYSWSFHRNEVNRFYGLGLHSLETFNLFGQEVIASQPLLIGNENYGLYFPGGKNGRFDLAKNNSQKVKVSLPSGVNTDFYFYCGLAKEVLEQHHLIWNTDFSYSRNDVGILHEADVPTYAHLLKGSQPEMLSQAVKGSMSHRMIPAVVIDSSTSEQNDLFYGLIPILAVGSGYSLSPAAQALHSSFEYHFITYIQEALDRGLPVIHPLALQFPSNQDATDIQDQFMLGDEIMVAPLFSNQEKRSVYFPQGIWTDPESNQVYRGRRSEIIQAVKDRIPIFARNGTILPLKRGKLIDLHYFPKLGAEYFIYEPELSQISQVHAAPAADILRLEIETAVEREYEWVIHNVAEPALIETRSIRYTKAKSRQEILPGEWFYDSSQRNLHIRATADPGTSLILNVGFEKQEGWFLIQ